LADAAIVVLTNLPDRETAQALARVLVEGRLAACVNIGAIEMGIEIPVAIKTRQVLYSNVEAAIRQIHPYELPEIVAVPITDGCAAYLDWIRAETQPR